MGLDNSEDFLKAFPEGDILFAPGLVPPKGITLIPCTELAEKDFHGNLLPGTHVMVKKTPIEVEASSAT